ncbi:hypothetical protein LTR36_008940 [Oleoguttula mirabilis]|uniref:Uncharacterized protein n=1 Tax=Oleoguttula mirabilis TaxID=1507867 RepID=A0AAV9J7H7_9PEZI|nr:hypothetical protein LTR36_008940 [Oleoguttula mirabilis]
MKSSNSDLLSDVPESCHAKFGRHKRKRDDSVTPNQAAQPGRVTKVQWHYDQTLKSLARQHAEPRGEKPAIDKKMAKEWQQAQDKLRALRRGYFRFRETEPLNKQYQKKLAAGNVASPTEFYQQLFDKWWPLAYKVLQDGEVKYQKVQETAMQAGLEPAEVDSDLMIFKEHWKDGTVDSEAPALWRSIRGSWNDTWYTRHVLWSLQIPHDHLVAYQSAEMPETDIWDADSVGFGSSRSQWWNMGQPPSVKRKKLIRGHCEECERLRDEAERLHGEYLSK